MRSQVVSESLTIGGLAKAAGVHVETVRYYQRRGLLREPARPLNGIRRYAAADVSRLRFIKHAQESGFSLDEVNALLGLSGRPACRASRAVAAKKLEELSGDSQTAIPRSTALSPPVLPISCWYPFLVVVNGVVPTYNSMLSCRSPVNFQRNLGQLGRC
ncbi:MAG: MerR family transcriptional regulator [Gammaproteobacteria bacterium]|nr:MAG: MerR family transcriptional regulator [Gammaproteobacteria bacterium]